MKRLIHLKKIALFCFALFTLVSCNETDWTESYKEKEKSPFGTYILHNEASSIFGEQEIITLKENIYDYLFTTIYLKMVW